MVNMTELQKCKQLLKQEPSVGKVQFIPGLWVNGKYFWLPNQTEKVLYEEELVIKVTDKQIHSKVDFHHIYISNHSRQTKDIKFLALHHFQNVNHDCLTFVSPTDQRIFHLANQTVCLMNLLTTGAGKKEYTTVPLWDVFSDQIWHSVKTGELKFQPMAKGSAASILAIKMAIDPKKTEKIATWSISGNKKHDVAALEQALLKNPLAFPIEK